MNFVIPVALQIHLFSKNKKVAGYMQESNRTLLNKSTNINDKNNLEDDFEDPYLLGYLGMMNEIQINKKDPDSSFRLKYQLEEKICEINRSSNWYKLGKIPSVGDFLIVKNTGNGLETDCIVMGTFNSEDKSRLLLTTNKVKNSLLRRDKRLTRLSIKIRIKKDDEIRNDPENIELYKRHGLKEKVY